MAHKLNGFNLNIAYMYSMSFIIGTSYTTILGI